MEVGSKYQSRTYRVSEVCFFRKTKEAFGGLSNMASGYPLIVNGKHILTSEALYQACRFPHLPNVQEKIIKEKSPMTAKMVSKPFRSNSRQDWDNVRVDIMYWCLRVKLAQNFLTFGQLLESTCEKSIVEESSKDAFWGAIVDKKDSSILVGVNALGRLLMKLRQEYNSANRYDLLFVEPLNIPNFVLFDEQIQAVDERQHFIDNLQKHWKPKLSKNLNGYSHTTTNYSDSIKNAELQSIVSEPDTIIEKSKSTSKTKRTKKQKVTTPQLPFD